MNLDKVFGIHEQALQLRARRAEVLAANLANADTPGYKARDFDFREILRGQLPPQVQLAATRPGHIVPPREALPPAALQYRVPQQPSLDGNTVEVEREQVEYSANAVQYQASLRFLDETIRTLRTAIKGAAQ
ncbi:flagellar basal body rod protein FlgB [endosymbiont of unidentified scaly snail isolate Monju]|uniref:flagellar basal body rod protein FlgB n=1 Tax=endosymbiont of unidentified scaly snail isolate Monju TaxID=1248727 RepID=UPI0003892B8C|nr:flagellar basal body rod protein FlgB [endosymbiont of unidentified scaly snail isolate Monju]BAN68563.1 flagellar basal-body rod protein FlgB [endosymbiont of unidentified scaly snail isolate Monju]